MIGFKTALRQYNEREMERLSGLPAFQELAERHKDIRRASEGELARAFINSNCDDVYEALGICFTELDDIGSHCH